MLCLQDKLKRVRASQREQQAAAAREAELLSADHVPWRSCQHGGGLLWVFLLPCVGRSS
jgi:hypothetical protein